MSYAQITHVPRARFLDRPLHLQGFGDATTFFGVSTDQMTEFDGRMAQLDLDINRFIPHPTPEMTPDQFAGAAAAAISLKLRWGTFHPSWIAWRDAHTSSSSRVLGSVRVEFGQFENQYNLYRNELISLGAVTTAPPAVPVPPPPSKSSTEEILEFLNSIKWIAVVGLAAYIIVGTDIVHVIDKSLKRTQ